MSVEFAIFVVEGGGSVGGRVEYRSSAEFQQEWVEKYGEEEKSKFYEFVEKFVEFVKKFVRKVRFVG